MDDKDRQVLKDLSSRIWSEKSVSLSLNDDLRDAISKLKVYQCRSMSYATLKKIKYYDYYLILKNEKNYYFLDTARIQGLEHIPWVAPVTKIENYNVLLRKNKLRKINDEED